MRIAKRRLARCLVRTLGPVWTADGAGAAEQQSSRDGFRGQASKASRAQENKRQGISKVARVLDRDFLVR